MSGNIKNFKRSDVTAEACSWIAQLETGDMTSEDFAAFREWMQRSPSHAHEIKRLAHLSNDLNVLTEMAGPLEEAMMQFSEIVARPKTPFWRRPYAMLAGLAALLLIGAGVFSYSAFNARNEGAMIIATAIGDYQETILPDGSQVELNSNTQIEIDFTREQRKVRLLRGEAFFAVEKDPARPFVVAAGDKYVMAVGTAFAVRLFDAKDDFEVTVTEGRVAVSDASEPVIDSAAATVRAEAPGQLAAVSETASALLVLKAGQNVIVSAETETAPIVEMSERDVQRKLAWQEGLFDFSETPLIDVIQEVSRHTAVQIEISDPELRNLRFGGVFRTGETGALLHALETSFEIEVEYVSDDYVRLKPRREL